MEVGYRMTREHRVRDRHAEFGDGNAIVDIVCEAQSHEEHPVLVARFERVPIAFRVDTGALAEWEWVWTGSLALRRHESWGGPGDVGDDMAPRRQALQQGDSRPKKVRLHCPRCNDNLTRGWDVFAPRLDQLAGAGVAQVGLAGLVAILT